MLAHSSRHVDEQRISLVRKHDHDDPHTIAIVQTMATLIGDNDVHTDDKDDSFRVLQILRALNLLHVS